MYAKPFLACIQGQDSDFFISPFAIQIITIGSDTNRTRETPSFSQKKHYKLLYTP
jgi:hypothetical protein